MGTAKTVVLESCFALHCNSLYPAYSDEIYFLLSGTFEITDSERRFTGAIRVMLKWKFAYQPPSGAAVASDSENCIEIKKSVAPKLVSEEETQPPTVSPSLTSSVTVSSVTNLKKLRDTKDLLQQIT